MGHIGSSSDMLEIIRLCQAIDDQAISIYANLAKVFKGTEIGSSGNP